MGNKPFLEKQPLSPITKFFLFFSSLLIVGFGQPAWVPILGYGSAFFGFALFWRLLLEYSHPFTRFKWGFFWYVGVQMIQLWWSLGHPYNYIYLAYAIYVSLLGVQYGFFSLFITQKNLHKIHHLFGLAALWVLLEWVRLFFMSGHPWNPIGLALSVNGYSRQFASLWGVYGLSFWVALTNFFVLRTWVYYRTSKLRWGVVLLLLFIPFVYGFVQFHLHEEEIQKKIDTGDVTKFALVQTAFPIEEAMYFPSRKDLFSFVFDEWKQILTLLKPIKKENVDIIVLPELVVPFGTFYLIYDYDEVLYVFESIFGPSALDKLPKKEQHLAMKISGRWRVNNAFWVQGLANVMNADVVVGLEDKDFVSTTESKTYTVAYLAKPDSHLMQRYEKRILVPMGEYIPSTYLADFAAQYGITSSFSPGTEAKLLYAEKLPLGISICYEEIMGNMMRDSKLLGAKVLVNLSNDGWFPHYGLNQQHLEHGRLRTVEMGIPLVRSTNTGVTTAIDSLGEDIAVLGQTFEEQENLSAVLVADVPNYTYFTPYTFYGDKFIIILSALLFTFSILTRIFHKYFQNLHNLFR